MTSAPPPPAMGHEHEKEQTCQEVIMITRNVRRVVFAAAIASFATSSGQHGAAQVVGFERGQPVRVIYETKPSERKQTGMLLKVVAIPNDRVRVTASAVFVNDVSVNGFSRELVGRVAHSSHVPAVVPDGQYLVMGEERSSLGDITEYWGVHSAAQLEEAK